MAHGHVLVDGHKTDIASYLLKPGQTISIRPQGTEITGVNLELSRR